MKGSESVSKKKQKNKKINAKPHVDFNYKKISISIAKIRNHKNLHCGFVRVQNYLCCSKAIPSKHMQREVSFVVIVSSSSFKFIAIYR